MRIVIGNFKTYSTEGNKMYVLMDLEEPAVYGTSFSSALAAISFAQGLQEQLGLCRLFKIGVYIGGDFVIVYTNDGSRGIVGNVEKRRVNWKKEGF